MPRFRVDIALLMSIAAILWLAADYLPFTSYNARSVKEIKRSGKLVVLTQFNPTTYYLDRDGKKAGPEYKLIKYFAQTLGVTPHFETKNNLPELLDAIAKGQGDIAAAGLSITQERKRRFLFTSSYQSVRQQVVCRRGGAKPQSVEELPGIDLEVIGGSSYEEKLIELKREYPELSWKVTKGLSAEQLLERVWRKQVACTILDSNIVAINRRYYPELKVRFDLADADELAWLLPQGAWELQRQINEWLETEEAADKIKRVMAQYYGHVELFDYVDTASFVRRLSSRYPELRPHFQKAAQLYGLSESLLAAQAYQESHWNPRAQSPTGVRGIMMLTLNTAKAMGVSSRLNSEQSIMGGARYFARLKKRLAREVEEPDLTWFALAAYNVGMGHLSDARKLTHHFGGNSRSWHDVQEYLPLLSDPKYYKFMKYGYARGSEPVIYVKQVRQYHQILVQHLREMESEKVIAEKPETELKGFFY